MSNIGTIVAKAPKDGRLKKENHPSKRVEDEKKDKEK
jgi:hypothetical protein